MTWKARFKFKILRLFGVLYKSVAGKESIQLGQSKREGHKLGPMDSLLLGEQCSGRGRYKDGADHLVIRIVHFLNF